jgi:hypothetical protein
MFQDWDLCLMDGSRLSLVGWLGTKIFKNFRLKIKVHIQKLGLGFESAQRILFFLGLVNGKHFL